MNSLALCSKEPLQSSWVSGIWASLSGVHDELSSHPIRQAMEKGSISVSGYGRWLHELYILHTWIDGRRGCLSEPMQSLTRIIQETSSLVRDLESLEHPVSFQPTQATQDLVRTLECSERERPGAMIGACYVLGHSRLQSQAIAQSLKSVLPHRGESRCLEYHLRGSEGFAVEWRAFLECLSNLEFNEEIRFAVRDRALDTSRGLLAIYDQILEAS